ncbi:MAG: NADH:flavin oxidoreductase/NADH oxidase [Geminicoccaceae bacterium]|nr:MAG: NADH:flavin oxidoreductase/NADH oxidase [Geminicoccaceae bacterium]
MVTPHREGAADGPHLFRPLQLRSVTLPNRIVLSPMCQYCAVDGVPDDWHFQHLASRAVGGAGLVFTEVAHVEPRGRITPGCLGTYSEAQALGFQRIVRFIKQQGVVPGMQIGHAGRKASANLPWRGGQPLGAAEGAWTTVAPSAVAFADGWPTPDALDEGGIKEVLAAFRRGVAMARDVGFEVIELHAAHGYLGHQFLSPLANRRNDGYGGDFAGRTRFLHELIDATRSEWPDHLPLFVRLSVTDWVEGGWNEAETTELVRALAARGDVDLIDCSSGGMHPAQKIEVFPGYQVPFAERLRARCDIATGAVGMIQSPHQAEQIVATGAADLVFMARTLLADPYWPQRAAHVLGAPRTWPPNMGRGDAFA